MESLNLSDDEVEYIPPDEALKMMTQTWINEAAAPKLLPHRFDLVEPLIIVAEDMSNNISQMPGERRKNIKCTVHEMELHRVAYVINSYVRTRLMKIENDPIEALREDDQMQSQKQTPLLSDKERTFAKEFFESSADLMHDQMQSQKQTPLLSDKERTFAKEFFESSADLMRSEFLKYLPANMCKIPVLQNDDHKKRVFFEVLKSDLEDMTVPNLQTKDDLYSVPLTKGSKHLAPFSSISDYLEKGDVKLL
uniref:DNA replication complex GINS protein SLD5 n=2 Tax=Panagrolaimus sp. JU765 TaxID=591449 RepID=A0AC34QNP9_9BILA